jgi:hypothetical protein
MSTAGKLSNSHVPRSNLYAVYSTVFNIFVLITLTFSTTFAADKEFDSDQILSDLESQLNLSSEQKANLKPTMSVFIHTPASRIPISRAGWCRAYRQYALPDTSGRRLQCKESLFHG